MQSVLTSNILQKIKINYTYTVQSIMDHLIKLLGRSNSDHHGDYIAELTFKVFHPLKALCRPTYIIQLYKNNFAKTNIEFIISMLNN